jgi:chemotaxis protein CheD
LSDEVLNVGVAELKVTDNSCTLASFGLGSCVAVAMFDPLKKVAGLAHVMLPDSRGKEQPDGAQGKFADTAVPTLVEELKKLGARKNGLRCKIVGGAQMFEIPGSSRKESGLAVGSPAHIGARNIEAVKQELEKLKVPLIGEDTGGNYGRTVKFNSTSGELEVSSINHGRTVL